MWLNIEIENNNQIHFWVMMPNIVLSFIWSGNDGSLNLFFWPEWTNGLYSGNIEF